MELKLSTLVFVVGMIIILPIVSIIIFEKEGKDERDKNNRWKRTVR